MRNTWHLWFGVGFLGFPGLPRRLVDGTVTMQRPLMRRAVDGRWQYRRLSADEALALQDTMMEEQELRLC